MLIFSDSGVYVILGRETLLYVLPYAYIMAIVTIINLDHPTPPNAPLARNMAPKDLTY